MLPVIEKIRFMEYGKPAPKNSRYEGQIMSSSVFGHSGFMEYTGRTTAVEMEESDAANASYAGGFLGYTSRNKATKGLTMTSLGPLTREKRREFRKIGEQYFSKKGDLIWDMVISLESFEQAKNYNLEHYEDYAAVISTILPQFFSYAKFRPDNMFWWMDYHINTEHPHMHVCFMEKEKTRTRGKFTEREMKELRRLIIKEISARKNLEKLFGTEYKEAFRRKDAEIDELLAAAKRLDLSKIQSVRDLMTILPRTGRFQYNARQIKPYRQAIDNVTDNLLNSDELRDDYEKLLEKLDIFDQVMNDGASGTVNNEEITGDKIGGVGTLKQAELDRLHASIGNYILHEIKEMQKGNAASGRRNFAPGKREYDLDINEQEWTAGYLQSNNRDHKSWEEYRSIMAIKTAAFQCRSLMEQKKLMTSAYEQFWDMLEKGRVNSSIQESCIKHQIAWMEFYGEGTPRNPWRAYSHILDAVRLGSTHSWALQARIAFSQGMYREGMAALRSGSEHKEKMAMYLMGRELITGRYCPRDRELGLQMICQSAGTGYKIAEDYLRAHNSERYQSYISEQINKLAHKYLQGRKEQIHTEISEYTRNSKRVYKHGDQIDDEIEIYLNNA